MNLNNLGVGEMSDYYQILGVSRKNSQAEIKKAYYRLALQHHPDKGGDEQRFKEISKAYHVLGDPMRKKEYDRLGHLSEGYGGDYDYQKAWEMFRGVAESMFDQWEYADDARKFWKILQRDGDNSGGIFKNVCDKIPSGDQVEDLVQEYNSFYKKKFGNLDLDRSHKSGTRHENTSDSHGDRSQNHGDSGEREHLQDDEPITLRVSVEEVIVGMVKKLVIGENSFYIPTNLESMKIKGMLFHIVPVSPHSPEISLDRDGNITMTLEMTLHQYYYGGSINLFWKDKKPDNEDKIWIPGVIDRGVDPNSTQSRLYDIGSGAPIFQQPGKFGRLILNIKPILPRLSSRTSDWLWSSFLTKQISTLK